MNRISGLVLCVALSNVATVSAQDWATGMFQETSHDFGAVARAAKVEYRFTFTNKFRDDVHIAGVRSSCGCTMPRVEKDTIKSRDKGEIVAEFNTNAFAGQRGATVTVTIDRPQYAEVQLQVRGYIRTDIVLNPGQVSLGAIDQGTTVEKKVAIEYAGRDDWKITDVKTGSPSISAKVKQTARGNGRVAYELLVSLKDNAPLGYLQDQLTLITNDRNSNQVPVRVEGRIVPELSVSPSTLMIGVVQPGQKVTKQIVVKAKKPFRVTDIECGDKSFKFEKSDEAKTIHLIPVIFTAGEQPGRVTQPIKIRTDLGNQTSAELTVYAQIAAPLAGN